MSSDNGTGGGASRSLDPGIVVACPHTPRSQKLRRALATTQTVDGPSLWMFSIFTPPHCSVFPDEPGRGLKPRRRQYLVRYGKPGTARSIAAVRKGSPVKMLSLAASPRPQHRSPFLARQPASLLLAWTREVGGLVNADDGNGSLPYTPPQCTRSATSTLQDLASVRPPVL